jgi:hypothetical protein
MSYESIHKRRIKKFNFYKRKCLFPLKVSQVFKFSVSQEVNESIRNSMSNFFSSSKTTTLFPLHPEVADLR